MMKHENGSVRCQALTELSIVLAEHRQTIESDGFEGRVGSLPSHLHPFLIHCCSLYGYGYGWMDGWMTSWVPQ
jgi:hypothetical protein